MATIFENLDDKSRAIEVFEEIITSHPLSFYGIMSTKKLLILKPDSSKVNFYFVKSQETLPSIDFSSHQLDADYISSLVRLRALSKIDSSKLIQLEIKRLRRHSIPIAVSKLDGEKQTLLKSQLHLLHSRIIQQSGNYLTSFKYLYEALEKKEVGFSRSLLEVLYPGPFLDTVQKNLKGIGLDPLVLLSLIRQESVFNPEAQSPVGARGLMQLMPQTARRFQRSVRDKHLVNPQNNISLGVKYFRTLLKRYDGNLVFILSAYNAGESRVEKWRSLYFDPQASIIKNVEAIPFLETRNYVKLIFRNIYFYKLLHLKNESLQHHPAHNQFFDINLGFNN
jgi:soluble lytic murein transglycosylase